MEILSQQEIDNLLSGLDDSAGNMQQVEQSDNRSIRIYDFRRPDILFKYQIRDLQNICELMTHNLALTYSHYHPQKKCSIRVVSVDQLTIEEYYRSLPSPAFLYKFDYGGCLGCVDIGVEMVMRGFIRRNISYNSCIKIREFDSFDIEVCKSFIIKPMLDAFCETLQNEVSQTLPKIDDIQYIDRTPEYLSGNTAEMGVLVTMEMQFGDANSIMNLFLTKQMTELLIKQEVLEMRKQYIIPDGQPIGNAYVRLGSRTINDEMKKDIKEGSVVELNTLAGEPLDLYVDDKPFARGEVVVIDDHFGLRITELLDAQQK